MARRSPDELVGEIIEDRYAVLDRVGAELYRVYDLRELRQLELRRHAGRWEPVPAASPPHRPNRLANRITFGTSLLGGSPRVLLFALGGELATRTR
jgi:hypothetical protein